MQTNKSILVRAFGQDLMNMHKVHQMMCDGEWHLHPCSIRYCISSDWTDRNYISFFLFCISLIIITIMLNIIEILLNYVHVSLFLMQLKSWNLNESLLQRFYFTKKQSNIFSNNINTLKTLIQ